MSTGNCEINSESLDPTYGQSLLKKIENVKNTNKLVNYEIHKFVRIVFMWFKKQNFEMLWLQCFRVELSYIRWQHPQS